ncbi:hypothetical protein [Phenylobacterium sp.]|uniref:hypothetical protein n=1 Tax=Phenylobacterium sp. TaxID=1871053 RepID=UPI0030F46013
MHFVYLIANGNEHTKIGHARDVRKRLQTLSCGSSSALEALHAWERVTLAEAKRIADAKVAAKKAAFARHIDAVRDYWRGERDSYPGKPA